MAYSQNHLLITWRFAILATDEIAQFGLRVVGATPPTGGPAFTTAQLQALYDAAGDLMSESLLRWAIYSQLASVKVAAIGTDGDYLGEAQILEPASGDRARGTAADVPPQGTVVLSLRSGGTLGRANYGRCYLPHVHPAQTNGGPTIDSSSVSGIVAAGATFIRDVSAALPTSAPGPYGAVIMSDVGSGITKPVEQVAVDNILDTQRRRARQLAGVYTFVTV